MNDEVRKRAEQKWVVVTKTGIYGTASGGPLTRDAAWLLERWYNENFPAAEARALKLLPKPEEAV